MDIFNTAAKVLHLYNNISDYKNIVASLRKHYPRAYEKWTVEDDEELRSLFDKRMSIVDMAKYFQRKPSAIESRLRKLGLTK